VPVITIKEEQYVREMIFVNGFKIMRLVSGRGIVRLPLNSVVLVIYKVAGPHRVVTKI
jgi:hypothetical protein